MNQIWTKEDIATVIDSFDGKDFVCYKGIIFVKITPGSADYLIQYLEPLNKDSAGANASGIVRSIVESSYGQFPCNGTKFILDNSKEEPGRLVPLVSLHVGMFKPKSRARLEFVLAHEIAHVLNDDIQMGHETVPLSPEFIANEIRADKFANDLLGSNQACLEVLTKVHALVLSEENIAASPVPLETLEKAADVIQQRIAAAS